MCEPETGTYKVGRDWWPVTALSKGEVVVVTTERNAVPLKLGDVIRDLQEHYDPNTDITARTPHGTFRFEITEVEDGDYGGACLVLREINE